MRGGGPRGGSGGLMASNPQQRSAWRRRMIAAIGVAYVAGAAVLLLWPTAVTGPFSSLLAALRRTVPYGDRLLEVGANVVLFVPLGWAVASLLPRGRRWLVVVGAVIVSSMVEFAQGALLPGRSASLRDVAANSLGAAIGVGVVALRARRATDSDSAEPTTPRRAPTRTRRWATALLSVAACLVAMLGALAVWVLTDAMQARDDLTEIAQNVPALTEKLRADPESAHSGVVTVQDAAARARAATTGVHWTIVGWLPWIGSNTRALQTVTASVDTLAEDGLPPILMATEAMSSGRLTPRNGRIDTSALVDLQEIVVAGHDAVVRAHTDLAAIDRTFLVEPLAEAVDRLDKELARAGQLAQAAAAGVQLLPPMLGADGPRSWLVLAQNNAELRSTGGVAGAALLLNATDGALSIASQKPSGGFGPYTEPVLPLTEPERTLFGDELGRYVQDVNLTPDFPRSAELAAAMWRAETGQSPDNALSIDPVALASLLVATGPVQFTDLDGEILTLSADDAADFLMSGIYTRYLHTDEQDAVFALAARAVLGKLMSSDTDTSALVTAVAGSIRDGRLLAWSRHPEEQALLERLGAAGTLRGSVETAEGIAPEIGVFLNLTTSSKTGYYLEAETHLEAAPAAPDGSRRYLLRVRLTNLLKPGQADTLPEHVKWGNRDGKIRVNVVAYAPKEGTIAPLSTEWNGFTTEHAGLQASAQTVKVPPSEATELAWEVTLRGDQSPPPVLRVTPGARGR